MLCYSEVSSDEGTEREGTAMASLNTHTLKAMRAAAMRRIDTAENTMVDLHARLADIAAAERLLAGLEQGLGGTAGEHAVHGRGLPVQNPYRPGSIKFAIWQALADSRDPWLTTREVQVVASEAAQKELALTSVGPALSDMKASAVIARQGLLVALSARVSSDNSEVNWIARPSGRLLTPLESGTPMSEVFAGCEGMGELELLTALDQVV